MPSSENPSLKPNCFRWLHFSDIHVGVKEQQALWPRFGHLLDGDLEKALDRSGTIDLVLFSGDMVQMGTSDEFDRFDEIMCKIIDRISDFQARPPMIALPGNHDLVRPDSLAGHSVALANYWQMAELRERFWDNKGEDYRNFINGVFENFTNWQNRLIERGIHVRPSSTGLLAGDASYVINTSSGSLGIAALNSTWLQLNGGDYTGRLHVDVRQLHAITDASPDQWARSNDVSVLVTHQPPSWLHPSSPSTWENDINPAGRFDVHLYGHMHEPDTSTIAYGGGQARRSLQAASLFGMEVYNDSVQRIQGYSVCEVAVVDQDRTLTVWPRRLIGVVGGEMKLGQDLSQNINEDTGCFSIPYTLGQRKKAHRRAEPTRQPILTSASADVEDTDLSPRPRFNLDAISFALAASKAHLSVRQLERDVVSGGLKGDRIAWVAADWGMGHEGFVWSISEKLGIAATSVFALDFNGYRNRKSFFERLQTLYRVSFQEICEAIADAGPSILIFDDLDFPPSNAVDASFEVDVEGLAQTVSDFANEAFIIIRTRRPTRFATFEQVELKALDEVDVGIYAAASEIGSGNLSKPEAASKLFRHTDGVPNRIDVALQDLEIITLDELMEANPDFSASGGTLIEAPPALVATVSELRASEDRQEQRAWNLLLALSALPHGEQLGRLKRFLGPHPITLAHARALIDRSLVNSVSLATFEGMGTEPSKALVVPRSVREYVRNAIDDKTAEDIDLKALELHFGEKWTIGEIHGSATGKRVRQPLCDVYEIQNASTLILRTVRRSLDGGSTSTENALRLAIAFVDALEEGDHFRTISGFCEDMLSLIEHDDRYDRELNVLRYEYARSLRMTGRHAEARANFDALDEKFLSKHQKQSVQLGLALCLDSQGDHAGAAEAAKKAIAIDRQTGNALQAQAILTEQMQDSDERVAELKKILLKAQKKQNHSLVNTINLTLAAERRRRGLSSEDLFKQIVVTQKKTGDYYNAARAIVSLASLDGAAERLTSEEKAHLAAAYNYLYHERLYNLFDRCHAALWKLFSHKGDAASLLNLFRHSSFIWRLNGREEQETKYLAELAKKFGDLIAAGVSRTNRDGAYLIARVSIVMGQLSAPDKETRQTE